MACWIQETTMNNPIILGLESYQTHIPYTYEPITMTMVPPWFPMFSPHCVEPKKERMPCDQDTWIFEATAWNSIWFCEVPNQWGWQMERFDLLPATVLLIPFLRAWRAFVALKLEWIPHRLWKNSKYLYISCGMAVLCDYQCVCVYTFRPIASSRCYLTYLDMACPRESRIVPPWCWSCLAQDWQPDSQGTHITCLGPRSTTSAPWTMASTTSSMSNNRHRICWNMLECVR